MVKMVIMPPKGWAGVGGERSGSGGRRGSVIATFTPLLLCRSLPILHTAPDSNLYSDGQSRFPELNNILAGRAESQEKTVRYPVDCHLRQ